MRGPTKTQRMYGSALVEAALFERGTKGILDAALGHRLGGLGQVEVLPAFSWKQPHRIAMRAPVLKQQPERSLRQWHVAVFGAFAMTDVNHYPGTVEVGDLQMRPFLQAQTTGVDGGETDFVAGSLIRARSCRTSATLRMTGSFLSGAGRTMLKVVHS